MVGEFIARLAAHWSHGRRVRSQDPEDAVEAHDSKLPVWEFESQTSGRPQRAFYFSPHSGPLLRAEWTLTGRENRLDRLKMTHSGHRAARNPAAQQFPAHWLFSSDSCEMR